MSAFGGKADILARSLSAKFAGIAPVDAPAFVTAQLIGGALAVVVGGWLWQRPQSSATIR